MYESRVCNCIKNELTLRDNSLFT